MLEILKTLSVWLRTGCKKKIIVEIFEKRRKQGLHIFQDMHHLKFFN